MKKKITHNENNAIVEKKTQAVQKLLLDISKIYSDFVLKGGASIRLQSFSNRHSEELDISFLKIGNKNIHERINEFRDILITNKESLNINDLSINVSHNCYIFNIVTAQEKLLIKIEIHKDFFDPIISDAKYFIFNNIKIQEIEKSIAEKISVLGQKLSMNSTNTIGSMPSIINAIVDLSAYRKLIPLDFKRIKNILEINFNHGKNDERNKLKNSIFYNCKNISEIVNNLNTVFNHKWSNREPLLTKKDYILHEANMRYKYWNICLNEKDLNLVLKFIIEIIS